MARHLRPPPPSIPRAEALRGEEVEVTLDPEELEGLDEAGVAALYQERLALAKGGEVGADGREDFSDMVAKQAASSKKKMAQRAEAKAAKKGKDSFKF